MFQQAELEVDDGKLKDLSDPGLGLAKIHRRRCSTPGAFQVAGTLRDDDAAPLRKGIDFVQHMVVDVDVGQAANPSVPIL